MKKLLLIRNAWTKSYAAGRRVGFSGRSRRRGLSLIEMMVVVALLAILVGIAAPNLSSFVSSRRIEDVARRIAEDMALARNEAVKRNTRVLMCVDASALGCAAAAVATDWARGWRLCYDSNNDNACDASNVNDVNPFRVQTPISASVTLVGPLSRVQFNPNGTVTDTSNTFNNFEIRSTSTSVLTPQWLVRFAASGAMSVRKG